MDAVVDRTPAATGTTMTNKEIVASYVRDVINTGNTDLVERYIAPEYVEIFDNKAYPVGCEGAREHVQGVRRTYPDLHLRIDMQVAEGPWVVTCYTMTGTHRGEWMGMKPSGKTLTMTGVNVDKVEAGKIVIHTGAANMMHVFLEAGCLAIVRE